MTFFVLSDRQPAPGLAVRYRLKPTGASMPATYDQAAGAWLSPDGGRQSARAHHQWAPQPEADPVQIPDRPRAHLDPMRPTTHPPAREELDHTTKRMLRAAFGRHPALLEELTSVGGAA